MRKCFIHIDGITMINSRQESKEIKQINKSLIDPNNKRAKQTTALTLRLSAALLNHICSFLLPHEKTFFARSFTYAFTTFQPNLLKFAVEAVLQATVDGDKKLVAKMAKLKPQVFLIEPADLGITEVESKLTWQKFRPKKPFVMAQLRNQLEMAKLIHSILKELEAKHKKSYVAEQWVLPEISPDVREELEAALQAKYHEIHIQPLIDVLAEEKCANGFDGELSDITEKELQKFRD